MDGNTRREDYENVEEWMHAPRVIGKCAKRTQTFFTVQTEFNVKELAEKQKECCKKYNSGLSTKKQI